MFLLRLPLQFAAASDTLRVYVHTNMEPAGILKQHLRSLVLLGLLLLSTSATVGVVAAEKEASKGKEEAPASAAVPAAAAAVSSSAPDGAAAGDLLICQKKLGYAEQRAENAENDLLSFRQRHEESMSACNSKLQQQQQQQQYKDQIETLKNRFNQEMQNKSDLERQLRQVQQQQQQEQQTAEDLRLELQQTQTKLQQQQQKEQQMEKQIEKLKKAMQTEQQQKGASGIVARTTDVAADIGKIYLAIIETVVSSVPLSLRDAAQYQAKAATAAVTEQFNKVYIHLEPYVEKTKDMYQVYVHPNAIALATWATTTGKNAGFKAAEVANHQLDGFLNAVYVHQPHLRPLIPMDFQGRLLLLLLLIGAAYIAGKILRRCFGLLCSCLCRSRSRAEKKSRKVFAADAAASGHNSKETATSRGYYGNTGRDAAQTPQPAPPRPFELEKRRKH